MRAFLLILFCTLILLQCFSQTKTYDFSRIDPQKQNVDRINKDQIRVRDSLEKNGILDSLNQLEGYVNEKTRSYTGIFFGAGFHQATITKINNDLKGNGFIPILDQFTEISFGLVYKHKKWVHDILGNLGLANKSDLDNTTIRISSSSLSYTLGFALLDRNYIAFYPFAGLSFQSGHLLADQQPSGSVPSPGLFETLSSYTKTTITKDQLNGTAGAEVDFYFLRPRTKRAGLIVSGRYDAYLLLIDGRYKANNHSMNYFPDWSFNASNWSVALKLVGF